MGVVMGGRAVVLVLTLCATDACFLWHNKWLLRRGVETACWGGGASSVAVGGWTNQPTVPVAAPTSHGGNGGQEDCNE